MAENYIVRPLSDYGIDNSHEFNRRFDGIFVDTCWCFGTHSSQSSSICHARLVLLWLSSYSLLRWLIKTTIRFHHVKIGSFPYKIAVAVTVNGLNEWIQILSFSVSYVEGRGIRTRYSMFSPTSKIAARKKITRETHMPLFLPFAAPLSFLRPELALFFFFWREEEVRLLLRSLSSSPHFNKRKVCVVVCCV